MYKQAFQTYKEIFLIILIVAIGLPIASAFTNATGVTIVVTAMLAFYAHRNVLTGEKLGLKSGFKKNPDKNANFSWGFGWRFAVLLFVPMIIVLIPSLLTISSYDESVFLITFVFLCFVFLGITLSLFGTVLPAASLRADASFSSALKRGAPRFWGTLWKLIYGPVAITIFNGIVLAVLYSIAPKILLETQTITVIGFCIGFLAGLISAFSTVLVATILSQVYLDSDPITFQQNDNMDH